MDDEILPLAAARSRLAEKSRGYAVVIDGAAVGKVPGRFTPGATGVAEISVPLRTHAPHTILQILEENKICVSEYC